MNNNGEVRQQPSCAQPLRQPGWSPFCPFTSIQSFMFWAMRLKYRGRARQAADFLLEQNITKHTIIWLIPRPKVVLMKVCPTTSQAIFQRGVIRAGALRPELGGPLLIDQTWPFSGSWRKGRVFHAVSYSSLMKGRQSRLPPLIQRGLKYCCLWKERDQVCLLLCLSCCWGKIYNPVLWSVSLRLDRFKVGPRGLIHCAVK